MNKEAIMQSGKIGEVTSITLQGQIVEAHAIANGYANLGAVRDAIINTFSDSFKELHVYDDAQVSDLVLAAGQAEAETDIYKCENIIVESVDFPEQKYLSGGVLDWSATLKCYEESHFDNMGVIEKVDSFSMDKDASDIITITHRIYAKGVNTTDLGVCKGGFDHARTFVESRRGLGNIGSTFIGVNAINSTGGPMLIDESENINRLEGTYEIIETWRADPYDINDTATAGKVHARCSVDISKSTFDSDFTEARVTYKLMGGKNTTAAEMRSAAKLVTHSGVGNTMYTKAINHGLNIHPCHDFTSYMHEAIDINIEEDLASKTFTKTATYTNDPRWVTTGGLGYPVWVDHDVSIDTDEITSITTVSISGNIGSIGPQAKQKLAIQDFLKTSVMVENQSAPGGASADTVVPRAGADMHDVGSLDLGASLLFSGQNCSSDYGLWPMLMGENPHSSDQIIEQFGSLLNFTGTWALGYYNQYCYMMNMPKSISYIGHRTINPITLNINNPKNIEISQQMERNTASFSIAYSDADWIENYESASYNISVQKPIVYRKSNPSANIDGHYSLTSFGGKTNFKGTIDPMYTRQKHTIRVNLVHSQNKGTPAVDFRKMIKNRARQLVSDLDNLFLGGRPVALPSDHETYVVSDNETGTKRDLTNANTPDYAGNDTISKSKVTSYNSNAPLISMSPDPDLNNCVTKLSSNVGVADALIVLDEVNCLNGTSGRPAATKIILSPGLANEETLNITGFGPGTNDVKVSAATLTHSTGEAAVSVGDGIGSVW